MDRWTRRRRQKWLGRSVIDDDWTPEQCLGHVAASALEDLGRSRSAFVDTGTALALLAQHSGDAELAAAAEAARLLASRHLTERVRDVASALPLRGLDYG